MNDYNVEETNTEQLDSTEERYRICAYCGKEFFLPYMVNLSQYAYKLTNPTVQGKKIFKQFGRQLWFCSWTCMSKFRKAYRSKNNSKSAKD
jgi:hypothetical protein